MDIRRVARSGSFAAVARDRDLDPSSVSTAVAQLEGYWRFTRLSYLQQPIAWIKSWSASAIWTIVLYAASSSVIPIFRGVSIGGALGMPEYYY